MDLRLLLIFVIPLIWLIILVPPRRFFKDMPKDVLKKGQFKGYAYRTWFCTDGPFIYTKRTYRRLILAYISTRFLAWKLDFNTLGEECGIAWGIENVKKVI